MSKNIKTKIKPDMLALDRIPCRVSPGKILLLRVLVLLGIIASGSLLTFIIMILFRF